MQYAKSQLLLSKPISLHFFTSNPWQEAENVKHVGKNSNPRWVHKGEKWNKSIWFGMWCLSQSISVSLGRKWRASLLQHPRSPVVSGHSTFHLHPLLSQHFHSGQQEGSVLLPSELQPVLLFGKLLWEQWFLGHPSPSLSRMSKPWITCEFRLCLAAHGRFGVPLQPLAWGN